MRMAVGMVVMAVVVGVVWFFSVGSGFRLGI
jgi:hypothetical protein